MNNFEKIKLELIKNPKVWLVTGVAGFIGSNLLKKLLELNQKVVGLDNFATGHLHNLERIRELVTSKQWSSFKFVEGDIINYKNCENAIKGIDYVLHQAAIGSVPRSIEDPIKTNSSNISGFLNILHASKEECVKSFTYAASSSTYGDHTALPKVEDNIGNPLSPYAVTKYVNELYSEIYARTYNFKCIGLRYFNVFGEGQDPNGAYAAVIPKWISSMIKNENVYVNGSGETSRDFCFIENIIQMNILSATAPENVKDNIFNVANGDRTSLNQLYHTIKNILSKNGVQVNLEPIYQDFRIGDVLHSQADITKAKEMLGFNPEYSLLDGLERAMPWYISNENKDNKNLKIG